MAAVRSNPSVRTDGLPDESTEQLNVVESPASGTALARFEFETDKGNEGTKILMVEWDAASSATDSRQMEDWQVSWEGKTTVLPIRDPDSSEGDSSNRRVYFLLPPGAPIPPLVTISRTGAGAASEPLRTKPLPAIFHPALLGAETRQEVGLRGVLHTIWAKKRLVELQAEMDREAKSNGESVGLEMALQERNWIVEHFGLSESYAPTQQQQQQAAPLSPTSPTSPRSPIGGKLGEKLKGLKLATSPTELAAASQLSKAQVSSLSPQVADVAIPSFLAFQGRGPSGRTPGTGNMANNHGVASLDAIIGGGGPGAAPTMGFNNAGDTEEELFALPMSPRSPEMKRSPFSML
ncbi:hypothetical protein MCOR25_007348 [Pyricularia grisea]|uniref:Uncharacterized protein n=1 Tax=Pyricularia grisea TaxID=148305 RepID=A0A6P8ATM4_PYRGI|nr:uncharacterized protein PgNI_09891 [Pyricularia grisea]KAI6358306.1 hypothetical protein MCOR25_007348 [Pyricularia grisea]TLD05481.1 hypothetical protein PgNI_09891 [Pyricularia grisea]